MMLRPHAYMEVQGFTWRVDITSRFFSDPVAGTEVLVYNVEEVETFQFYNGRWKNKFTPKEYSNYHPIR